MGVRHLYIWDRATRKFIDLEDYRPQPTATNAPHVIDDSMPATVNHADGRTYESKSAFRKATRAAGYVEVGNDTLPKPKRYDGTSEKKFTAALRKAFEIHGLL